MPTSSVRALLDEDVRHWQEIVDRQNTTWLMVQNALGDLLDDLPCSAALIHTTGITLYPLDPDKQPGPEARKIRAFKCKLLGLTPDMQVKKHSSGLWTSTTFYVPHPTQPDESLRVCVMEPFRCTDAHRYKIITEQEIVSCGKPPLDSGRQIIDLGPVQETDPVWN